MQEMIDICDFAVGLSRQLYGLTIASERPGHRMMEQWHPLGVVGVITAFNFPVAVWAWNAPLAAVCGDTTSGSLGARRRSPPSPSRTSRSVCAEQPAIDPAVFTLVIGDRRTVGERMPTTSACRSSPRTGSTRMGRASRRRLCAAASAARFSNSAATTPSSSRRADLDLAMRAILFGAVGTAGQRCTSHAPPHRARVHRGRTCATGWCRPTSNCRSATRSNAGNADGTADRRRRPSTRHAGRPRSSAQERRRRSSVRRRAADATSIPAALRRALRSSHAAHDWPIVQQETFAPILYLMTLPATSTRHRDAQRRAARASVPRSSPTTARGRRVPVARAAATAASPTSTSAPAARKSAARSAAKRKPAAAARAAATPGRPTCAGRPSR